MKPRERVKCLLENREIDFLPSQIDFTPRLAHQLPRIFGIEPHEFDEFIGNHLKYAYSLGNVEVYLQDDVTLKMAESLGYAQYDQKQEIVFDRFGVGWDRKSEGVFCPIHPLEI